MSKVKKLGYSTGWCEYSLEEEQETHCSWSGCYHEFQEGDWATVEMENGREGIYCDKHTYGTEFSEYVEIEMLEFEEELE